MADKQKAGPLTTPVAAPPSPAAPAPPSPLADTGARISGHTIWLTLLTMAVLWLGVAQALRGSAESFAILKAQTAADGSVGLSSVSEGPFLITGVLALGATEVEKSIAVLPAPRPVANNTATLDAATLRGLEWRSAATGEKVAYPDGKRLVVLYSRPQYAQAPPTAP